MKEILIKEQVRVIEDATRKAGKSKETALKFLKEAGIVSPSAINVSSKKK